ncbi:hypothetical protein SRHO_G00019950 [Serrasalmus rhombeus]
MCTDLDEKDADNNQPLENERLEKVSAEAEAEAVKELMNINLDETDETVEKHLGCEVMNVTDTEPEAPTLTMQTYSDEVDTPNDHPLEEEMFEVMDTDDHLDTEIEYLEDETTEATLTEAEVEAIKELMLLFIEKIEAESLGCHVMSSADTEAGASTHNMQTHLDETDPSNDQLLDVEKKSDGKAVWNTTKGLMDDSREQLTRVSDKTGMTVDPVPIKSWADMVDKTEGNINQTAEIETLKKDTPENETKRDQIKNTRRGTRGKGRKINYKKNQEEKKVM